MTAIAMTTLPFLRKSLLDKLASRGIVIYAGVTGELVSQTGLEIVDNQGERRFIEADTIVLAAGARPNSDLGRELEGKVRALYSVGDCVEPRRIREAIAEGARLSFEV